MRFVHNREKTKFQAISYNSASERQEFKEDTYYENPKKGKGKPSLFLVLLQCIKGTFFAGAVTRTAADLSRFIGPQLLRWVY